MGRWKKRKRGAISAHIKVMMSDTDGYTSSKRVILFLSVLVMIGILVMHTFFSKVSPQYMFDGFLYLAVAGLTAVSSEKLLRRVGRRAGLEGEPIDYDSMEEDIEPSGYYAKQPPPMHSSPIQNTVIEPNVDSTEESEDSYDEPNEPLAR